MTSRCMYFKIETDAAQNLKLTEKEEAPTSGYSTAGNFLQFAYSLLMAKNNQNF